MVLFAMLLAGAAEAKAIASSSQPQKLSPPLTDVSSDKKFFGPPFPADYPDDKRPVPNKGILDKVKGPDQPYPALQSKEDYDRDYVKDENSDTGAWQAQFEYDRLRRKLAQEEADERRAQDYADREGRDVDGAQRDSDSAGRNVDDAQKGVNDASKGEEDIKTADDFDGPPSDKKLKELEKAVADAEARHEKAKKAFEECKRQLEEAKAHLDDLKAQQKEMEEKLAADTKLWAEQKTVKLNMRKTKQSEASAKVQEAQAKLAKAVQSKAEADKALAKEKAEHEKAQQSLQKEKDDVTKVEKKISEASAKLQALHGYKPAQVAPTKSGTPMTSMCLSVAMILAMHFL